MQSETGCGMELKT